MMRASPLRSLAAPTPPASATTFFMLCLASGVFVGRVSGVV